MAAAVTYVALVLLFVFTTMQTTIEILDSRDAAISSGEILQTLESRHQTPRTMARTEAGVPIGSPFLEGQTASVASAMLLQRVLAAAKRVSGNTLSSQVDIQGPQAKSGFVSATFNIELASASLQALLYDLEAGMPFVFVDELVVQPVSGNPDRMRVVLGISAQRRAAK
ncbi:MULTISPECIES: type II secretion system protein GspM [unclassified Bradyrhizobium]|uniref:type II secretion system protein GspM n=1 Tax=unclassified Bradyrhizobium TaxID=2631580 RepID=UPI00138EDB17|nr:MULTISPECIES: type II secretion system protein GspM [unclassified Bradyrhizobium]